MNKKQLKLEHPEIYNEIFQLGKQSAVKKERQRIEKLLEFADTHLETVKGLIQSGDDVPELLAFYGEIDKKLKNNKYF
jgi:hypothetical protein